MQAVNRFTVIFDAGWNWSNQSFWVIMSLFLPKFAAGQFMQGCTVKNVSYSYCTNLDVVLPLIGEVRK